MIFVPWSYVNSWRCNGCGLCCKEFEVVLTFNEWLNITKKYGVGVTRAGLNKLYLGKRADGSCVFLYPGSGGKWLCGLQHIKPLACKIWPFKVLNKPKYGHASEALFEHLGQNFYVYVDPFCSGIRWGKPSMELIYRTIPEFIEIALGIRENQVYSTMMIKSTFFPIRIKNNYKII
ncbi:MAG: YkgJ family cysteine cluster protein [Candidatus Bathyarchaeia archaeon]